MCKPLLTSIFLLLLGVINAINGQELANQNLIDLARANEDFGYQLLHRLELEELSKQSSGVQPKNLFISPFSIGTVLTMVMAGGVGDTASEIKKTLKFNPNQTDAQLFAAYSTLLQQLNSTSAPTIKLQLANGAALQNNYPLLPAYLNVVNNDFNAKVFSVDFEAKAAEATEEINRWAGEKTNGKIPKLFDEPLDRDTRLVLLNALYFKGGWAFPFHNSSTEEREFFLPQSGQKVNVSMMAKYDEKLRHASFEDGDLVELPYEGNTLSMMLFLPNQASRASPQNQSSISGAFLKALKAQSEAGNLLSAYGKLRTTDVNLMLPRFKVESSFKLKPILQVLGIRTAFDEQKVDFSGMTGQRNLVLSEVVHKTFVKVNEEGSEAAAVTAGVMVKLLSARFTDPKTVNFNRPFLFAIRDNAKQLTLFAGIINKPEY